MNGWTDSAGNGRGGARAGAALSNLVTKLLPLVSY